MYLLGFFSSPFLSLGNSQEGPAESFMGELMSTGSPAHVGAIVPTLVPWSPSAETRNVFLSSKSPWQIFMEERHLAP